MATVVHTATDLRAAISRYSSGTHSLGLVPTMGALHEGHASLVTAARGQNDVVVASVFVNPLQFGDCDDYRNYPRQLDRDVAFLTGLGVDIVFAPTVEEMYPDGEPMVWIRTGQLGARLEGASRPGHFDGVATVVAKLFHLVQPYRAYFGQKDAQQVAVLRRMVTDLDFPVEIVAVPIIRGADGLAESSRNQRLSPVEREQALAIPQALFTLRRRAAEGAPLLLDEVRESLRAAEGVTLDHLEIVDPGTLADAATPRSALALVAAYVGPVRLIDNMMLQPAHGATLGATSPDEGENP